VGLSWVSGGGGVGRYECILFEFLPGPIKHPRKLWRAYVRNGGFRSVLTR